MLPIQEKLIVNPNNRPFVALKEIRGIIIHWTANTRRGTGAWAHRRYFNRNIVSASGRLIKASAHYMVDDSNIVRTVPDHEKAFHCGTRWNRYHDDAHTIMGTTPDTRPIDSPNNYTIGIEMCVNVDSDFSLTRQNTIELTQLLLNKYSLSVDNVYRHFDMTGKPCPAMMLDDESWNRFKDEVNGVDRPIASPSVKVQARELNVRKEPRGVPPILRQLYNGQIVPKLEEKGNWIRIGTKQWVYGKFTVPV